MEQRNISIGEVDVPIILDGGEEWFPVTFITTKVLLRSGKGSLVNQRNKNELGDNLNSFIIKYGDKNEQESKCINKASLKELLKRTQIGRLNSEQRISQNNLHKYLGIELLPIEEQDVNTYDSQWFSEVDDYTKDIIENELNKTNPEWIRMCSNCNKHFPLTNKFFAIDSRIDKGFTKVCRVCSGNIDNFTHQDHIVTDLKKQNLYEAIKEESLLQIYDAYRNKKISRLPDCYENKDSYLRIINGLFNIDELNVNNLTSEYIIKEYKLKSFYKYLSIDDVYKYLFGDDFYYFTWKYPKFRFKGIELTYEIANNIINNYINENKIKIDDIFTYDYLHIFKQCRLSNLTQKDMLGFIVQFYDYKYAGYLFKTVAVNYYKQEENLLFDLKYLVEKDMNIDKLKIPLYLTKYTLKKKSLPLYNYIILKKNGSLFEWFDKLYPNTFTIFDFEMNAYRNEFDSDKEMYINELLNDNFKNVIYNQKHTDRTITLDGMIPDWLIITENGVWIIEYFGLYEERQYGKSSRVTDYIDKTKRKIERYKEMNGYRFIFLYPNDTEDDLKGCREIIVKMKENPYTSMV